MEAQFSAVCTLFEGHYHYGVAALINSLYESGFRGNIFAGYRGTLPEWAKEAQATDAISWNNASELNIRSDLKVYFLPVTTGRHLTNYKAAFMLALKDYNSKGFFYFDPDITIKCKWAFFEEWIQYGVAVVQEITANHVSPTHPRRMKWVEFIHSIGKEIKYSSYNYFNGGFCGVSKNNFDFVYTWEAIIEEGINSGLFDANHFSKQVDQTTAFPAGDQDALNTAAMCSLSPISDVGPEGMDFIYGGWLMSHATAHPKPWKTNFLRKAFKGQIISLAEKNYWSHTNTLIKTYSSATVSFKKTCIKLASFLNRFYAKR